MNLDANHTISKTSKFFFLFLLLILNIIIRIPSIPHEKGVDSFFIHLLATSLSIYGESRWWLDKLSIFGLFPYSYASSTPYSLSGISQLTNLNMEHSILLYCVLLGLFSMFSMYLFASTLYDEFLFKYISAMLFSLSQGILLYTTWEVSGRGAFLVFIPLLPYLILKSKIYCIKRFVLLIITIVFLFATHHYAYFTFPFLISFIYMNVVKSANIKVNNNSKSICIYIFILIVALIFPFFAGLFIEGGSRYKWIIDIFITTSRWVGPLIFFAFGGSLYILLKKNKKFEEWYILISLLFFVPLLYSEQYGKFLIIPLIIIFISKSIINIVKSSVGRESTSKRTIILIIIIILLVSCTYSSYFNHERLSSDNWYMSEETYLGGIWAKSYIPEESHAVASGLNMKRLFSTSEGHLLIPTQGAVDLAYGLVNKDRIKYTKISYLSKDYYFEGPYKVAEGQSLLGTIDWILSQENINREKIRRMVYDLNITYILEDVTLKSNIMHSVNENKNRLYDSGSIRVYKV